MAFDETAKLRFFCLKNPVYIQVLDILEKKDADDWIEITELKEQVGIDAKGKGEGFASWQAFTRLVCIRWGCGYLESIRGIRGRNSYNATFVRAAPGKKENIRKFLDKVAA